MPDLHVETLALPTRKLFDKLASESWLPDFYLAGGTGLALEVGHRTSVDLDFFSQKSFDETALIAKLSTVGTLEVFQKATQSVIGVLDSVKFSFLGYPYPLLKAGPVWMGVALASVEDIACMKLDALSSRGTKRDFIDLYVIAERIPVSDVLKLFEQKYASIRYNMLHIKKSLVFFDDAEGDPMPDMRVTVTWQEVKEFFLKEAANL